MSKFTAKVAGLALAAALVTFGSVTSAQAQSCGNANVQTMSGEVCDNGGLNNTQAVGCCAAGCASFVTVGTTCRASAGTCDAGAEVCDGTSAACPADSFAASTVVCRPSLAGVCDSAENCTGSSGACPADTFSASTVPCRGSAGVCDVAENCTGGSGACPADLKSSAVCRADAGSCDVGPEFCDGNSNDCPADNLVAAATLCRGSAGDCDTPESCTGTSGACPVDAKSSALCRASTGSCDPAESCNGSDNVCPPNLLATTAVTCRGSVGVCDTAENCTGASPTCPVDAKSMAVCRASNGVCDLGPETCDGTNNACPADSAAPSGTPCRSSAGTCDPAETCNGASSSCPADLKSTSLCRASAGECDLPDSCDGTNNACPLDEKSTAVCRPAVSDLCDETETCDGTNNACPDDELINCEDDDGVACTEATCDPTEGCVIADNCIEICRSPGFWQTHSGDEKGENIGQAVLDEVGTLNVCGEEIQVTTNLGLLNSSLEGLCVRTQGVHNRQLYRQLVTTAFNCAISEGGSCDNVLEGIVDVKFSECSALCEGNPVADGPTLEECKDQLDCFNGGGRWIDGQCARGTCAEDTDEYCGADYGDCPLVGDQAQDCVRFADSCAKQDLCSEDLDAPATICPKPGPASSPKICNEARHNDCTIDYCYDPADYSCEGICGGQAPGGCYCDLDACSFGDGCADHEYFCGACP